MCPRCGKTGYLRRHGWLYGNDTQGCSRVKRGMRVYCSKRFRLKGCGRTFSIILAKYIPRHSVQSKPLWCFLQKCMSVGSVLHGRVGTVSDFSEQSAYRWWCKFRLKQSELRTVLAQMRSPPAAPGGAYGQLLKHIEMCLGKESPIAVFQETLQRAWPAL